ncbi:MAG: hypothetical protein HUU29_09485 [Planctomycetaceae bacterium]|nr:hypothetical protein [Planctomycetaceae bacterium]
MGSPSIIQPVVHRPARLAFVSFSVDAQTIGAAATYTKLLPLGAKDYQRALIMLHSKNTIADARRRRIPALIFATRDNADATCIAGTDNGSDRYQQGYDYATDGKLSGADFAASNGAVEIRSARIDGGNLEIVFFNTTGSAQTIDLRGAVYAFRDN